MERVQEYASGHSNQELRLKEINWNSIRVCNFTADELQLKYQHLVSKVRKYRTLNEINSDLIKTKSQSKPKLPPSPCQIYCQSTVHILKKKYPLLTDIQLMEKSKQTFQMFDKKR